MATKAEIIADLEAELTEVKAAIRGISKGGASGSARAGRSVSFMTVESLQMRENRLILKINRLRELPEKWSFKKVED